MSKDLLQLKIHFTFKHWLIPILLVLGLSTAFGQVPTQNNPLNISDLKLWWKAGIVNNLDNDDPPQFDLNTFTNRILTWHTTPTSQGAVPLRITQGTASKQPILYKGETTNAVDFPRKFNFNNYVKFSGNQTLMNEVFNYNLIGRNPTVFIVATAAGPTNSTMLAANDQNAGTNGSAIKIQNNQYVVNGFDNLGVRADVRSTNNPPNHTHYGNAQPRIYGMAGWPVGPNFSFYGFVNEYKRQNNTRNAGNYPTNIPNNSLYVGSLNNMSEFIYDDIAEIIIYDRSLGDPSERRRIESYLAVKYGITLKSDYVFGQGITAYTYNDHTGFNNNITAVARDNQDFVVHDDLYQKKSRSVNPNGFLTLWMGGTAVNNKTMSHEVNISTGVPQRNYFFIGDNDASLDRNRLISARLYNNTTVEQLQAMNRTWKMVAYASQQNQLHTHVSFSLDKSDYENLDQLYVIVAEDPAFTQNVVYSKLTVQGSGPNQYAYYIFDNRTTTPTYTNRIPIPNHKYFTLGEFAILPEFDLDDACQFDPLITLPATDDNGIPGSWNPATIDPSAPQIVAWFAAGNTDPYAYPATFTPDVGTGASPQEFHVLVYPQPQTSEIQAVP